MKTVVVPSWGGNCARDPASPHPDHIPGTYDHQLAHSVDDVRRGKDADLDVVYRSAAHLRPSRFEALGDNPTARLMDLSVAVGAHAIDLTTQDDIGSSVDELTGGNVRKRRRWTMFADVVEYEPSSILRGVFEHARSRDLDPSQIADIYRASEMAVDSSMYQFTSDISAADYAAGRPSHSASRMRNVGMTGMAVVIEAGRRYEGRDDTVAIHVKNAYEHILSLVHGAHIERRQQLTQELSVFRGNTVDLTALDRYAMVAESPTRHNMINTGIQGYDECFVPGQLEDRYRAEMSKWLLLLKEDVSAGRLFPVDGKFETAPPSTKHASGKHRIPKSSRNGQMHELRWLVDMLGMTEAANLDNIAIGKAFAPEDNGLLEVKPEVKQTIDYRIHMLGVDGSMSGITPVQLKSSQSAADRAAYAAGIVVDVDIQDFLNQGATIKRINGFLSLLSSGDNGPQRNTFIRTALPSVQRHHARLKRASVTSTVSGK